MRGVFAGAIIAISFIGAGLAASQAEDCGIFIVQDSKLGKVLADPNGMTVYTFGKDKPGKSN